MYMMNVLFMNIYMCVYSFTYILHFFLSINSYNWNHYTDDHTYRYVLPNIPPKKFTAVTLPHILYKGVHNAVYSTFLKILFVVCLTERDHK